jgi:prolyl oligopeptidase
VKPPTPPTTRTVPVAETLFGTTVPDPYRWLEDEKSDEVKRWMDEQDRFARGQLALLPGRDRIAARLRQMFYVDSISAPRRRGTRFFYRRTHADKEKGIVYWRGGEAGAEHVLLDPNQWSADGSVSLGTWQPSWDGRLVAYAVKPNNSDEAELRLIEVATGKVSAIDVIPGAKYAEPSWTPTGNGFYYVRLPVDPKIPVADRPGHAEIRFHTVGDDPKNDRLVKEKTGNPREFAGAAVSRDGHFLFYYLTHGWNSTDIWFQDLREQRPQWRTLVEKVPALFSVTAFQDRFYIATNDGAPRFKIMVADPAHPERARWKQIVAEDPEAVLDDVTILGGHLGLTWMRRASSALEIRTLDGAPVRKVELPGLGQSGGFSGLPEDDVAYFDFTSFTQPPQIFRTSILSGVTSLWAEVKVPFDPAPYTVEQVRYPSKDGTSVSMFLVHRKDMKRDGSTPFLLYGYGGFNVNLLPGFTGSLVPWLEAGGGYAVPNLRGGGEYGEDWHKAGMLERKQNVFDDFLAAAGYLVANGYTRSERLAIRGGSNGGLLVGAAMTQRPDLFRAVVCQVPLLDMVRYHLYGSGKTWIEEYGSAEDERGFRALHAYSPYHHVKPATRYPALLMMSADSDDRVDPMHARKMAAAVQAASTSGLPVWLRIEQHSGHGGADLVKQAVEMGADAWVFLMAQLGMNPV